MAATALRSATTEGQLPLLPPLPPAASQLLGQAHRGLAESAHCPDPGWRYATAHLAALRAAAAVLAARTRPQQGRRRPRSAWVLITEVAPELGEWAAFFAAGAAKRAAAEAGLSSAVTEREADDLVRDAGAFLAVVESTLIRSVDGPPTGRLRSAGRSGSTGQRAGQRTGQRVAGAPRA